MKKWRILTMLQNKIYWNLDYKEALKGEYNTELLDREFKCLKKHNFNILFINYENGYAVIEDNIKKNEDIKKTYKSKDLVPYVQLRPIQRLCDSKGNLLSDNDIYYQIG